MSEPKFQLFKGDRVCATEDLDLGIDGVVLEGTLGIVLEEPRYGGGYYCWVVWDESDENEGTGEPIEGYHRYNELGFPIEERKTWPA